MASFRGKVRLEVLSSSKTVFILLKGKKQIIGMDEKYHKYAKERGGEFINFQYKIKQLKDKKSKELLNS